MMHVRLVSHSQPTAEFADLGIADAQELIAYCARVSNPANQLNTDTSERLIKYLVKHKHWSPLEMVSACCEVTTTRDIARQILRHRSFSFQEFSQRYADPTKDLAFVHREARLQDPKNRQNSIITDDPDLQNEWNRVQDRIITEARSAYSWAIDKGIAKEQARAVLPEGLIESRLYMNGTLRSWIHFIELRMSNGTQWEHQQVARACAEVIARVFPIAADLARVVDLPENFCVASFLQLTTHPTGSFSPCPYLGGTAWQGKHGSIMEAWRSPEMEELRDQFLKGQKPKLCSRCWHEEKNGKKSLRLRLYDPVKESSDFAIINRGNLIEPMKDALLTREYLKGPKVLTIKNGNVCNAKCRSCHPGDSSRWIDDARKLNGVLGKSYYLTSQQEKNWSDEQLQEILAMSTSLVRLELFGGEPLYNKKVIDLLRKIVDSGHSKHITLYVNTNGSVDITEKLPEVIEFQEVEIGVSLDGVGEQFDYIRHGLEYTQVIGNIRRWQQYFDKHQTKYFIDSISTVSVLNVLDLPLLKKEVRSVLPDSPFWNLLINPAWLFIKNMPDRVKVRAIEVLSTDPEFADLINVINQPPDTDAWNQFLDITQALDSIRGEDWRKTFPELASLVG